MEIIYLVFLLSFLVLIVCGIMIAVGSSELKDNYSRHCNSILKSEYTYRYGDFSDFLFLISYFRKELTVQSVSSEPYLASKTFELSKNMFYKHYVRYDTIIFNNIHFMFINANEFGEYTSWFSKFSKLENTKERAILLGDSWR